ncbi:MAG: hypothetical protein OES26_06925 [Gammaproteobacteria bacterium]|nr:hypothetical protein [Gammaproteobacteria bacterium]
MTRSTSNARAKVVMIDDDAVTRINTQEYLDGAGLFIDPSDIVLARTLHELSGLSR